MRHNDRPFRFLFSAPFAVVRLAGLVALLVLAAGVAGQGAGDERRYDIPAQPLDRALMTLGTVSRIDILYENGVVDGKTAAALAGRYTPRTAIAAMLRGTGLAFRFTSLNAVVIFPPDRPPGPGRDAWEQADAAPRLVLDVLRVTAAPMIGSPPPHRFDGYGRAVQIAINRRLQDDPRTSRKPFRARLALHIDAAGTIRRLDLVRSTGQAQLDADIRAVLERAPLADKPPADLPQPIWFEIVAR